MSEQEITADRLDDEAKWANPSAEVLRRAARTIRRLEGEVARKVEAFGQQLADAELGSLVRRIREHPETTSVTLSIDVPAPFRGDWGVHLDTLTEVLRNLDALAERAAEEGERGPSGDRFRLRDGVLEWRALNVASWRPVKPDSLIEFADLDVVERVRKGVARGE